MRATVGTQPREGDILEIHGRDGAPPYLIRWDGTDRTTLVFPGVDSRVEAAPGGRGRVRAGDEDEYPDKASIRDQP